MMKHQKALVMAVILGLLSIFACVTINIYFPAEEVKSVAGEIVNDIRGQDQNNSAPPPSDDQSSLFRRTLVAFFSSNAWAQDATKVSNPTIRSLKQKMKSRYATMKPYYAKGVLKEGSDGFVAPGNTGGLGLKEKRDIGALVDAENSDRKALYLEVAKAMKIDPSQVDKIAEIFAAEWKKTVR